MSTPWLSETVKDLERQLKVGLFERTTRSVQLTEAGRVFSGLVSQVLDDLDDAVRVAQRMTARPGRALTLGYVIGVGLELLPRLVRTYLDRHPDQRLNSVECDFTDPTAGLRDHNVDAAIVRPPIGLAGIATLDLTTEPRVACLPEGHRLARRDPVTVADLLPEPIIAAPESPGPWRDYWLLTDYRTAPAPVVAEARTRDAELHMVAPGEGISITSAGANRYYARTGVVFVQISDIPYCSVALAWWPETSAAVADLVETARELVDAEGELAGEAAAQGQTILAASGDTGSAACNNNATTVLAPALSPYLDSVGGTQVNSDLDFEQVWNTVSAVAFAAYGIYLNGHWQGGWGGTSAAAPLWAAIAALTNASPYCAAYGSGNPGVLPMALYGMAAAHQSDIYGAASPEVLRDITVGNNDFIPSGYTGGAFPATPGYDLASGLGAPIVSGGGVRWEFELLHPWLYRPDVPDHGHPVHDVRSHRGLS